MTVFEPIFEALNRAAIASIPDLISLKRAAGRTQDLADIEKLEVISNERGNADG